MTKHAGASWLVYALGALCVGAIIAAFLVVGPPSQSAAVQSRTVKAQRGVVQQTVSGSGNVEPATQLNLGFKTSGVVRAISVSAGQYVTAGQLLAELNPQSAEAALEQSKASLQAAEAALAQEEEDGGESSGAQSGAAGSSTKASAASVATQTQATTPASGQPAAPTTTTPAGGAPSPKQTSSPEPSSHKTTSAPAASNSSKTSTSSQTPKPSAATREANLASARAAVRSDKLAVQSAEQAVSDTKLLAPDDGTIVSLSGEVGENVSGTGTSKASTSSGSSSGGSTGTGAGAAGARGGTGTGSGSTGASGSGSSSAFAVLSDLNSMQLVVALSESEIVHVHSGQPATVTIEALEGAKLAAHVLSVATLSSSSSGVVSYDVTFQLDQTAAGLRPGMSGSAEVVVRQEEGVNVPTSAISGSTVTVVQGTKQVRRRVVTGLAGNSSTIVLSGLRAGEEVALPLASTSSATSLTSRLAGRGGGLGGGLGSGLGGGLGGARLGGGFATRGGG